MNNVTLLGNLTKDVEIHYTKDGTKVGRTSIAVNNRRDDSVMFIDLVFFGKLAEITNQYLSKGSKLAIQGRIDLYTYIDNQGNKRQKHSVIVNELEMLNSSQGSSSQSKEIDIPTVFKNIEINEDEIPF